MHFTTFATTGIVDTPLYCYLSLTSPRGDSNPLTYRLQVGCATIALLGHYLVSKQELKTEDIIETNAIKVKPSGCRTELTDISNPRGRNGIIIKIMGNSILAAKTVIQCDFDGTITEEDQSFLLLDAFASGNWRQLLTEYRAGKISVGYFNTKAFAMVKEGRQTLVNFVKQTAKIRPGFHKLLAYCRSEEIRFTIVSNGLDFYISTILTDIGMENIEVFAAQTQFVPTGIEVKYVGPDGTHLDSDFKEAYTRSFLAKGYRVVYVGNGLSDISAAKHAHHVFARGELLNLCKQRKLNCIPFVDLNDVVRGLKPLLM